MHDYWVEIHLQGYSSTCVINMKHDWRKPQL